MTNTTKVGAFAMESKTPELDFLNTWADKIAAKVEERIAAKLFNTIQPSTPQIETKQWETREETLKRHNISDPTLNKWVRLGKITRKYVEGKPYYSVSSFYESLNQQ
jgi:hypothetical protein